MESQQYIYAPIAELFIMDMKMIKILDRKIYILHIISDVEIVPDRETSNVFKIECISMRIEC